VSDPPTEATTGRQRREKKNKRIKTKRDERRRPPLSGGAVSPFLTNRLGLSNGGHLCTSANAHGKRHVFGRGGGRGRWPGVGWPPAERRGVIHPPSSFEGGVGGWLRVVRHGLVLGGFLARAGWFHGPARFFFRRHRTVVRLTPEHHRHSQVGSSAGAAHLLKDNAGVLRVAHGGWKPPVESKVKSLCSDLDSQ